MFLRANAEWYELGKHALLFLNGVGYVNDQALTIYNDFYRVLFIMLGSLGVIKSTSEITDGV